MVTGTRNSALNSYRKRTTFTGGTTRKKQGDPAKELDAALIALDGPVDTDACWRIYHLEEDRCEAHIPPQPKAKNCKPNPYCIYRLGLEKFEKLQQSQNSGNAAEAMVRRNPEIQPCGLVNYGNFCYVNSFLQIWFNDLRFRQCVYNWRADPDWVRPDDAKFDIQAVMDCLQKLFLTLQLTPFETTDAHEFINLLRLDNQQQDVQEFHTLFFDNVERSLAPHPNGRPIRDTIHQLFMSRMNQTMHCECGYESAAGSEYRSLPISIEGFNSLLAAIHNFFSPETLADYKCSQCGRKGNTVKSVHYDTLPQVLIIQLSRYIFDNAKEQHRKLKSAIAYPRVLKASALQPDAPYNDEYELCAVMVHEGQNAQSGHYYDIIREPTTKQWFTYNDRHVQLEKRAPGYEGFKEPKEIGRATADQRGCYALIYQRKAIGNQQQGEDQGEMRLPPEEDVQAVRLKLENDFQRQSKEGSRTRQLWEHRIVNRHAFLNKLFKELEVKNGRELLDEPESIAFIPTSLLADLFAKEFAAVKDMHNLDLETPMEVELLGSNSRGGKSKSNGKNNGSMELELEPEEDGNSSGSCRKQQMQNGYNLAREIGQTMLSTPANKNRTAAASSKDVMTPEGHKLLSRNRNERMVRSESVESFDMDCPEDLLQQDGSFDFSAYEHIYAPEPLREVHFVLCKHGHVPLGAVLKGELKAVRSSGARRLIEEFHIQFSVHNPPKELAPAASPTKAPARKADKDTTNNAADKPSTSSASTFTQEWQWDGAEPAKNPAEVPAVETADDLLYGPFVDRRLRTGDDLCVECVDSLRTEALFREQLHQIDLNLADTMRTLSQRTFDPSNPFPRYPPEGAVWVSHDHIKRFKKIATAQMQRDGRLSYERESDEPAEKRSKNSDDEAEDDFVPHNNGGSKDDNDVEIIEESSTDKTARQRRHSDGNDSFLTNDMDQDNIDDENQPPSSSAGSNQQKQNGQQQRRMSSSSNGILATAEPLFIGADKRAVEVAAKAAAAAPSTIEEVEVIEQQPAAAAAMDEKPPRFNEDLYCKHGKLALKPKRVWLRKTEWSLLAQNLRHFDEPFPCSTASDCPDCTEESDDLEKVRECNLNQLQMLMDDIGPLLKRFALRKWEANELGQVYPFILCKEFVNRTRNINPRAKQTRKTPVEIPRICQDCLLCRAHALPYLVFHAPPPEDETQNLLGLGLGSFFNGPAAKSRANNEEQPIAVPLSAPEWEQLLLAYRTHVPEQPEPPAIIFLENGQCQGFCDTCHLQHNMDEEAKRFVYPEGEDIFVKLKGDESEDQLQAKASTSSSGTTTTMTTRRGAQKDLIKIRMRSDQTVMDLKLELMRKTKQSPNDQLLYLNEGQALDNQLTLGQAKVAANNQDNPLILIVQQRLDDMESGSGGGGGSGAPRPLEKGFKDTALSA